MKSTLVCNLLVCIIIKLDLIAAEVSLVDEDAISHGFDENVLKQIVNKLNEISEKVETIDNKFITSNTESKAQLNRLQDLIQTIVPAEPTEDQRAETSQCNLKHLNKKLQTLRNTIKVFNQTLGVIAYYFGTTFESCTKALDSTGTSGVYNISSTDLGLEPFDAYCLEDPQGGSGWTVILRRMDGSVSFHRNWADYKYGFGDPNGEYWLGLEKIHAMTSKGKYELWIELGDQNGQRRHAKFTAFEIGNEAEKYYLKTVGEYDGNAGDSFYGASSERKFSTYDQDNDHDSRRNCALEYLGAWWFSHCGFSSLLGEYGNNKSGKGVNWYQWTGNEYSLKYAHMAIRPAK